METDLQEAHRIQNRLKEIKNEAEELKIELDFCIDRIKRSGKFSNGEFELLNKPKLYWEVDVNIIKEKYPLLIPGIEDKIRKDAESEIEKLNEHIPVGLVKDAMKFYGVVDSYGNGDLTGLGVQNPKDNWVVVPASKL